MFLLISILHLFFIFFSAVNPILLILFQSAHNEIKLRQDLCNDFKSWLDDDINKSKLRLCKVGCLPIVEKTNWEVVNKLKVTLSKEFHEQ